MFIIALSFFIKNVLNFKVVLFTYSSYYIYWENSLIISTQNKLIVIFLLGQTMKNSLKSYNTLSVVDNENQSLS